MIRVSTGNDTGKTWTGIVEENSCQVMIRVVRNDKTLSMDITRGGGGGADRVRVPLLGFQGLAEQHRTPRG